ncbi:hypothetical protein [Algivirga pacifica]|uniref:STAS/SEC14 domain-containing protein n=1 Tax=Algivirga pacifica TaxID=1162670 RepID=A0ABP9DAB7_9BACT
MSSTLFYDTEVAKITYIKPLNTILLTWKGFVTTEQYIAIGTKAYEAVKHFQATNWISDQQNAKAVSKEASDWGKNKLVPMVIGAGIKNAAFILSKDIFNQMYSKGLESSAKSKGVGIHYCTSMQDAKQWIQQQRTVGV